MRNNLHTFAFMAFLAFGAAALTSLRAQDAGTDATAKPAEDGQVLTDESLSQILIGLGYEPKKLSHGYLITFKQDTWTLNIQVRLSDNQTKLGMNANLGVVDEDSVTAEQWKNLLAANGDIDPSVFYYDKEQKKLYIHRVLDNRALTPAFLKDQIDRFATDIRSTEKLWAFTK